MLSAAPIVPPSCTSEPAKPVEAYADVRVSSVSSGNPDPSRVAPLGEELIRTLWFNTGTRWTVDDTPIAQRVMEAGKNPGLGVRSLHEQDITGRGVNVAIIDQNLQLDHPEFAGKIVAYHDTGCEQPADRGSMHAPAVTSLLVGETLGTAPDARVYFAAAPSWKADAQYFADGLNWILDENERLPAAEKIRAVSVSGAPSGTGSPFTTNNAAWDTAATRAEQAGVLVLDCTSDNGFIAPGYYDFDRPDDLSLFHFGFPNNPSASCANTQHVYAPTSLRTQAEEYQKGQFAYQYTGQGGLSWAIPYATGVLAMGWQLRPELSATKMKDLLLDTAYVDANGCRIIDPVAFIAGVKSAQ